MTAEEEIRIVLEDLLAERGIVVSYETRLGFISPRQRPATGVTNSKRPQVAMLLRTLFLMLLLLGFARPVWAEWQLGAYLGGAHTQNTFVRLNQPGLGTHLHFDGVNFAGRSFDSPLYYGGRGGYFFTRHLGVEAEFIHLKVFAQVDRLVLVEGVLLGEPTSSRIPMGSIVGRFDISHGVNLILGNLVFRRDLARKQGDKLGGVLVMGRLGIGGTVPHPETEILGAGDQHYQAGRPAFQTAVATELRLWRGLYWLGEYKYTRTHQRLRIVGGTAETLLHSHHFVTGLTHHF